MSFDGVFTHLMVQELQDQLTSGRKQNSSTL